MDSTDQEIKKKKMIRERGENWTREEKDLFLEIMKESAPIIENKQSDTNTNKKKVAEWLKVQRKLKELTGKDREVAQLKGFWRRMKLIAKKHVSEHMKSVRSTCGRLPPPFPLEEDLIIMELCPTDFTIEANEFDSDGISQKPDHIDMADDEPHQHNSTNPEETKNESSHKGIILQNRSRQMMEEEHQLKMQYQEQQLVHQQLRNKMEIEILQLEKEEKELKIKLLKKQLEM